MRLLALIGALAIIAAIGAAVFFFGGFYSVAATAWEPPIVKWALVQVREASIDRFSGDIAPAMPGDAASVQAGARAFLARGCTNCHGGPGVSWAKFSEGLRPDPPDLKDAAKDAKPAELFWVIKNGINMTGMPSFGAIGVPDTEIWTIVAFLKKMPAIKDADFKAWTAPPAVAPAPAPPSASPPPAAPATPEPPANR
jgi:Cytochrome C oxidase, cbb3-type, subunit III